MEVRINDCPVDFELEGNERIPDVIDSISSWIGARNLVLYELVIDDERYPVDGPPDMETENVGVVNCIVRSRAEMVIASVDEALGYCDRASAFIDGAAGGVDGKRAELNDLAAGVSWLLEVLGSVMGLLGRDPSSMKFRDGTVSDLISEMTQFRDGLPGPGAAETLVRHRGLFADIARVFRMLLLGDEMRSLVVQSIDSPDVLLEGLRGTREGLAGQLENVRSAAVAYQSGRDAAASEQLGQFVDFIYRYIRACCQVTPVFGIDLAEVEVNGVTLQARNEELDRLLGGLGSALEQNDVISLADILEYEIGPALEGLGDFIDPLLARLTRP